VSNTKNTAHVSSLDLLRGIASLSVALYHFTNGNPRFLPNGVLKNFGSHGWVGVEAFFVISGFVIPFALDRAKYQLRDFGTFLLKRVLRLDPPYVCTISIIIALGYASQMAPAFQGEQFHFSSAQLALHFGYANAFVGYPWLNPVFWTLAIEAQYYVIIGLVFPLLISGSRSVQLVTTAGMACVAVAIPKPEWLFHWLPLFLLGMSTFQFRRGAFSLPVYGAALCAVTALCVISYGVFVASAGLITACVIAFTSGSMPPLAVFFGHISYSLYLLHVPIGGRVVNLGARFAHTLPLQIGVICCAFAASIGAAWLLHRFVERPAQRWSSSIGYKRRVVAPSGFGPREG
jgi:peptidoglycan/LPS O-acetylase OafA/YrhL